MGYFDWALANTRVGGVIAAHNAFRSGNVIRRPNADESSRVMGEFNRRVAAEQSVISTIYPAGDGTVLAVKIA